MANVGVLRGQMKGFRAISLWRCGDLRCGAKRLAWSRGDPGSRVLLYGFGQE
jgi:hypothetical protein